MTAVHLISAQIKPSTFGWPYSNSHKHLCAKSLSIWSWSPPQQAAVGYVT